jgi:uncharacterized protein YyaL (SSP411 family)
MADLDGPRRMAAKIEDVITDIEAHLEVAEARAERKRLNKALHHQRQLLAWCQTRAGYKSVAPKASGSSSPQMRGIILRRQSPRAGCQILLPAKRLVFRTLGTVASH